MEQGTWSSGTGNGLNCCLYVDFYCTLTKKLKHPCRTLKKTAIPLWGSSTIISHRSPLIGGWIGHPALCWLTQGKLWVELRCENIPPLPKFRFTWTPISSTETGCAQTIPCRNLGPLLSGPYSADRRTVCEPLCWFPCFQGGSLIGTHREPEGSEVGWDEWNGLVVTSSIDLDRLDVPRALMPGSRLWSFSVSATDFCPEAEARVFDFSA